MIVLGPKNLRIIIVILLAAILAMFVLSGCKPGTTVDIPDPNSMLLKNEEGSTMIIGPQDELFKVLMKVIRNSFVTKLSTQDMEIKPETVEELKKAESFIELNYIAPTEIVVTVANSPAKVTVNKILIPLGEKNRGLVFFGNPKYLNNPVSGLVKLEILYQAVNG
ncbi:MAG: hypothetical protein M1371_04175 [Actinobacteria bacterium]|nr:hypothetical protein [Actinomycetota bacterium]